MQDADQSHIKFCVLREEDIPLAGDLCSRAFLSSPSYVDIYQGTDEWRQQELQFLFERNIRMIYETQPNALYCAYDMTEKETGIESQLEGKKRPKLICFFMFLRSDIASATLWQKIKVGILFIPLRCGLDVFSRLMKSADHHNQLFHDALQDRLHYELQRMVVDPDYQGQRIGSKCLSQALSQADRDGLPTILSTQLEINVRFYQRLGFEVILQEKFSASGNPEEAHDSWVMLREPKSIAPTLSETVS